MKQTSYLTLAILVVLAFLPLYAYNNFKQKQSQEVSIANLSANALGMYSSTVAHFGFDEAKGEEVVDVHGKTGKVNGAVWTIDSVSGAALIFYGKESVSVDDIGITKYPITLSLWLKIPEKLSSSSIAKIGDMEIGLTSTSSLILTSSVGTSTSKLVSTQVLPETWTHVVVVHTENQRRVYIDGSLQTQEENTYSFTSGNMEIGTSFKGIIDEIRVYSRALSDTDVSNLFGGR